MCDRYLPSRRDTIPQPFRDLPFYGKRCLSPADALMEPYWGPTDELLAKCAW
jgi:hypothetical protein